jgi:hypothetical protein
MQALDSETSLDRRTLESLREGMREAAQWHDEVVEARVAKSPWACAAGCSHCCSLPVTASLPELAHLAAFIFETFETDQLEALTGRLGESASADAGPARAGDALASRTCALLVDGLCSAHAARPMACRGWNSRDAAPCIIAAREPDRPPSTPVDSRIRGTATAIAEGMRDGTRRLELDDSILDLRSALAGLLGQHEDWTKRWFEGERLPEAWHGVDELPVDQGDDGRWRTRD